METVLKKESIEVNYLKDILDNYNKFAGQYIYYYYSSNEWRLLGDTNSNYKLNSRLFNILNNNIRVLYYKESPRVGTNCYQVDYDLIKRLENYDKFLIKLMKLTKGKNFSSIAHIREYLLDYNFISDSTSICYPMGIQGRVESVGNLVIEKNDKIIFLPYYHSVGNVRQQNKIFKTLISIYIELYRPDLEYPYSINGNRISFEEKIDNLYKEIIGVN